MFYLAGSEFPQNAPELADSLLQPLRGLFTFPGDAGRVVRVDGGEYPDVNQLRIDLSGASLDARQPPPKPVGVGRRQPGLHALELEISGHPLRVQQAAVHFDVTAADVRFDYDRDKEGRLLLLLTAAKKGKVRLEISQGDLEALLLAQASAAAATQGIALEKVALDLAPLDNRSVAIAVRVTARKLFARANVEVKGQLKVDDALNAKLSALSCEGEGIVGRLAGNLIRPYLERFNDRGLSLTGVSLGTVRLHGLRIDVSGPLKVEAAFGS